MAGSASQPSALPSFDLPGAVTPTRPRADILANPDNYYVNVHNSQYPAGAIRGQLAVSEH